MSDRTTTAPTGTTSSTGIGDGHASLLRIVRSEWRKTASLRSTWLVMIVFVGLGLAFAALTGAVVTEEPRGVAGQVSSLLGGVVRLAPLMAVLGALTMSGEYTTGTITATLSAVPRRWPVLAAKALLLVPLVGAASLVASGSALLVYGASVPQQDAYTLLSGPVLSGMLAFAALMVTHAVLGLGIATLARSSAGAITAVVVLSWVLPTVLLFTRVDWLASLTRYAISGTERTFGLSQGAADLSPTAAVLVLVGWSAVPLVAGLVALQCRDA